MSEAQVLNPSMSLLHAGYNRNRLPSNFVNTCTKQAWLVLSPPDNTERGQTHRRRGRSPAVCFCTDAIQTGRTVSVGFMKEEGEPLSWREVLEKEEFDRHDDKRPWSCLRPVTVSSHAA